MPLHSYRERRLIGLEYALIFMASGAMFPFFNLYLSRNLGWSGTRIGFLGASASVLVMLTQPLWGRLSDASNKNTVLALALGMSACLAFLQPFAAGSFAIFFALRLGHAVSSGSISSMFDGIALDILGEERNIFGQYRLWGSLGFALAALTFGRVYESFGFTNMFFVYAGITAGAACVALRFDTTPAKGESWAKSESMRLGPVLANPALLVLLGGIFLVMTANTAGENFFAIFLDTIGATGLTGYAFATMALVEVPMFLMAPRVIDRFGYKPVLLFSTGLFGLKLVLNALFPIPWLVMLLQPLAGIGFALFHVSAVLMVDALVPRQFRSTGQAVLATVSWSLAGITGSLIFGRLLDTTGILAAFRIGGYVGLLGTLFIWLFVPSGEKQSSVGIKA